MPFNLEKGQRLPEARFRKRRRSPRPPTNQAERDGTACRPAIRTHPPPTTPGHQQAWLGSVTSSEGLPYRIRRHRLSRTVLLDNGRLTRLLHVHRSLETSAVGNDDPWRMDIAAHRPAVADLDPIVAVDVAHDLSMDGHGLGVNLRLDLPFGSDHEIVVPELDPPLHASLDRQVLIARKLAADEYGLTDVHDAHVPPSRRRRRRRCRLDWPVWW